MYDVRNAIRPALRACESNLDSNRFFDGGNKLIFFVADMDSSLLCFILLKPMHILFGKFKNACICDSWITLLCNFVLANDAENWNKMEQCFHIVRNVEAAASATAVYSVVYEESMRINPIL